MSEPLVQKTDRGRQALQGVHDAIRIYQGTKCSALLVQQIRGGS